MALKKESIYSSTGVIHANHIEKESKDSRISLKLN